MTVLRTVVRYGYAPFMMLGLTGAAYWVVGVTAHSYLWLAPLLALAYATAFAAERIAPFFDEWNDHDAHGDTPSNFLHMFVYEMSSINGVLLIPVICWLFPFQGLWPTQWPMWGQVLIAFVIADFAFMMMHYLSHRYAPLWRLHAVHHGVGRLYGMNGVHAPSVAPDHRHDHRQCAAGHHGHAGPGRGAARLPDLDDADRAAFECRCAPRAAAGPPVDRAHPSSASRQLGHRRRLQLRPPADAVGQDARHLQGHAAAADHGERLGRRRDAAISRKASSSRWFCRSSTSPAPASRSAIASGPKPKPKRPRKKPAASSTPPSRRRRHLHSETKRPPREAAFRFALQNASSARCSSTGRTRRWSWSSAACRSGTRCRPWCPSG